MKYANSTILVVSPDFPYPPRHGGLVDIWRRILALKGLGFEVDLVATVKEKPSREHLDFVSQFVGCTYFVNRTSHLRSMLSVGPAQVALRRDIRLLQLTKTYDYALLETEFGGGILDNPSLRCDKVILRIQNDESRYFYAQARTEPAWHKKIYCFIEFLKAPPYSKMLAKRANMLWFISDTEHAQFIRSFSARKEMVDKAFILPAPVDQRDFRCQQRIGRQVLFLGNFFTPLNRNAVRWYVQKVHPMLAEMPGYKLVLAGNTQSKNTDWLRQLVSSFRNIELQFDVADPHCLYESSSVFINPMLEGAGVKLKTINAIEAGLPVVTTSVGNEGTGLQHGMHLLVADEATSFCQGVRLLLEDRERGSRIATAAQDFLRKNYDHSALLERYFSELHSATV
jgi:glycosyltransferase involved in cell wall biosynthesis